MWCLGNSCSFARRLLGGLTLLAALLSLQPDRAAMANGNSTEIYRGSNDGYELIVGVQPDRPVVGSVHITITPIDLETASPVPHAQITVVAHDPEGKLAYQARAVSNPASIQYYDANITFESPGDWVLSIEISSDALGKTIFRVPLQVGEVPLPAQPAGTIVWLVVVSAIAGGGAYLWYRSRRLKLRSDL